MDPLSITVSVFTLITISAQITGLVRQFRDEINVVDTTLNGIVNDVEGFQSVLESMKETIDQEDLRGTLQATGHVGSHWKNLSRSLSDGEGTLEQLRSLIISVNKSAKFLDAPRKHLRFKSAIAQIAEFREQIQSYRAALQISLSTIILWNQTTLQKSTDQIPDKVVPDLNKLYDEFRTLGTTLNSKIERLQSTVANAGYHAESELISMTNLKECVQSAADVVSTASTTLAPETSERASVKCGSDFGDVFRKESNEPMQRWISSNTVYEYEDAEAPAPDPSETSTGEALTEYQSDSDSDIEAELVRALFSNGKKRKKDGDLQGAARTLKNCLSRFPATSTYGSMSSSQATSITGVSKAELLELLTETYCLQGAWAEAKSTMKEKLTITEHQTGRKSERYLWDTYKLSEVMLKTKDYAEAHLHGRQSLRGFKKLREQGLDGYEKSLSLLILICSEQGNAEEEEAYTALLESHQSNMKDRYTDLGLGLGLTINEKAGDILDKEGATSYTKLLVALCKKEFGRKPLFMIGRGREGYNCIVILTSSPNDEGRKEEIARITGCTSRDEARHAGAAKAYDLLTSRLAKLRETVPIETATASSPVPDCSSDKEFYVTSAQAKTDLPPYTADATASSIAKPVPDILVSPTLDSAPFAAPIPSSFAYDVTVRRAASDSHAPWHKSSTKASSAFDGDPGAVDPWVPFQGNLDSKPSAHRRAASTTTRPTEWIAGDDQILAWPRQPPALTSRPVEAHFRKIEQTKSGAQPNVTFDTIESSVQKSNHSYLDPISPISRGFLSKTFSLQGRSKSDDANLTKKKSLRAMLLPSSLTRSPSLKQEDTILENDSAPVVTCPLCDQIISHLSAEGVSLHVNGCLDQSSSHTGEEIHPTFELPGSDPSFTTVELPAQMGPQSPIVSNKTPGESSRPLADPDALWDLHRAYSKRDLSMDKFEAGMPLQPSSMVYSRGTFQVSRRQVLLLGDPQCGKTWLSNAWCGGTFVEARPPVWIFTKVLDGTELILHDRNNTALEFIRDSMRRAYSGSPPVILLCFDISSVGSFENVERRWNHEADLYPRNVPKILVGCKKDLRTEAAGSVWRRDAYKMTAKINAKAYFETSAVTKEGLDALFSHVAQMPTR
ncbi:hypothetical protein E8E12_010203 [Didymella heteroderae]|uniref:Azaphilone pigments biosynthesis cluster protein L N-terminal domain-containing protein n=1 Tax=Didymella heteroderae TaxID=1769908 RepID=A0A9P5C4I9_9PLEO|nr:hypothetical protein E8E12_010203 [Didymella heteroderae]